MLPLSYRNNCGSLGQFEIAVEPPPPLQFIVLSFHVSPPRGFSALRVSATRNPLLPPKKPVCYADYLLIIYYEHLDQTITRVKQQYDSGFLTRTTSETQCPNIISHTIPETTFEPVARGVASSPQLY